MEAGEHNIEITAADEAGNEATYTLVLNLKPVVVSKKNPNPVIYDGEYATITLKNFKHGEIYEYSDMFGYSVEFNVENKCDEPIDVYLSMYTSINDYQVKGYYTINPIAPEKKGTAFSYIEDKEIPKEVGNFSQIDSIVCIKKHNQDESFYRISTTFMTDAVKK
ncbi:MAG: hypothetical protein Q4E53_13215 [Eubacteriales bacterium]|nr:hypothetical protein [Eubacteriales bacterium]